MASPSSSQSQSPQSQSSQGQSAQVRTAQNRPSGHGSAHRPAPVLARVLTAVLWTLLLVTLWAALCWSAPWLSRWSGQELRIPGSMAWPAAQALAFPLGGGAALVLSLLLLGLWRSRRCGARPGLALLGTLVAVAGTAAALVPAESPAAVPGPGRSTAQVISWNSHDTVTVADTRTLLDRHPQAVVLPESNPGMIAWYLHQLGADRDYQLFHSPERNGVAPTTVLVSAQMGHYHSVTGPTTTLGTVTVEPEDSSSAAPRIIGVHTASPRTDWMPVWRREVTELTQEVCGSRPGRPVLAAGDFNATTAHGPLPGLAGDPQCTDALPAAGVSTGTWPVAAPSALRAQIDHVLAGPGVSVDSAGIQDGLPETSDHEAIRATVRY